MMKRAYIIGNGPSLARTNLDIIAGEPSFACNNIHLIYPDTRWRPTHYVRSESIDLNNTRTWVDSVNIHLDMGIPCYMSGFYSNIAGKYPNYTELHHCHHYVYNYDSPKLADEWHLPQLCSFGGSLIVGMQIALGLGYNELVLLGCDLMYHDRRQSHFCEEYEEGTKQLAYFANHNNLWAHIMGINYHARRGLPYQVINATIGGDLHIYPRARLEDIA